MNFVLNNGALGDVITSLPAMIYGRQRRHESMEMRVWAPSWLHDLLAHLLAPYGKFVMRKLEEFPFAAVTRRANDDWGGGPVAINGFLHNNHTRNATNMVDFAFSCLLDASPSNMNDRSYPVLAPLGPRTIDGKYILIPTNATSENKTFRAVVMRPVIEWALDKGYKVVLTGTKTSHTKVDAGGTFRPIVMLSEVESLADLLPKCIDMRECTTLLELRDLCGYASAVVLRPRTHGIGSSRGWEARTFRSSTSRRAISNARGAKVSGHFLSSISLIVPMVTLCVRFG
jgi:hypothetical protein